MQGDSAERVLLHNLICQLCKGGVKATVLVVMWSSWPCINFGCSHIWSLGINMSSSLVGYLVENFEILGY